MRRAIAEHMVRSERAAPHVTCAMEVDMTNIVAYRAARKEEFARREGIELTYLPFAIKAVTLALPDHPRLNAVYDDAGIIHRKAVNIGVAVGLEDGLVVPVIKHADRFSLAGLMHAVAELAGKHARAATPDDVSGGTFTVNNPGTFRHDPLDADPGAAAGRDPGDGSDREAAGRDRRHDRDPLDDERLPQLRSPCAGRPAGSTRPFLQQVKSWLEGMSDGISLY